MEQPPDPLPPQLVRLITSSPRDIALAVRIKRDSAPQSADSGGKAVNDDDGMANLAWNAERAEEAFDELGMEVVDELGADQEGEEDDERRELLAAPSWRRLSLAKYHHIRHPLTRFEIAACAAWVRDKLRGRARSYNSNGPS
jgi:hypothetical protein